MRLVLWLLRRRCPTLEALLLDWKMKRVTVFNCIWMPGHSESEAAFHTGKVGASTKLEMFPQRNTETPEGVLEMLSYRPR